MIGPHAANRVAGRRCGVLLSVAAALVAAPQAGASKTLPAGAAAPAATAGEARQALPQLELMGPGLLTSDLDRAIRFYRDGLGLAVLHRLEFPTMTEVMLGFGGRREPPLLILMQVKTSSSPPPASGDKFVLTTDDAVALAARLKATGFGPGEVEHNARGYSTFWITDPDGHRLEIVQRTPTKR